MVLLFFFLIYKKRNERLLCLLYEQRTSKLFKRTYKVEDNYDLQHVKEELADVIVYSQNLLDKLGLDADDIVNMKMSQNEAKYPVEKAKGKSDKYTELQ